MKKKWNIQFGELLMNYNKMAKKKYNFKIIKRIHLRIYI